MGRLDDKVMQNDYFKTLTREIFESMFSIDTDAKRIYIDLNHTVSILFRNKDIDDNMVIEDISTKVEEFISKYTSMGTELIFIYYTQSSIYHRNIFENWSKVRDERVDFNKSNFLKALIVAIRRNKDIKNLKVVNVLGAHPVMYIQKMQVNSSIKSVIISKDLVMHMLKVRNCSIFDGKKLYTLEEAYREYPFAQHDVMTLQLYKYFITMMGDDRNEYPGISNYGPKKSFNYVIKYAVELIGDLEHPMKAEIDKYVGLYDINLMMDFYNKYIEKLKEDKTNDKKI